MKSNDSKIKRDIMHDCLSAVWLPTLFGTLESVLGGIISVFTADILGNFANSVLNLDLSVGMSSFVKLVLCILIYALVNPAILLIDDAFMISNALKHDRMVLRRFHSKTYMSAMRIDEGTALSRLEDDPNDLRIHSSMLLQDIISLPPICAYLLYNTLQIDVLYTGIVILISVLKLIVPIAVRKLNAYYDVQTREYKSKIETMKNEMASNSVMIKLLGIGEFYLRRIRDEYEEYFRNIYRRSVIFEAAAGSITGIIDQLCVVLILIIGALFAVNEQITTGDAAAMAVYFSVFNQIFHKIGNIIKELPLIDNIVERVRVFYDNSETEDGVEAGKFSALTAENLSFSYEEREVLKDISFSISKNNRIAVCGRNGSGKSTLIKLIMGLNTDYTGCLQYGDTEIRELKVSSLRKHIAYAAQQPYLFSGTVEENIKLGNINASCADIDKVMEQVGISYLKNRTISLGECSLSGGEKQKIAIARALLKNAEILILDEPSNHLDKESYDWLKKFLTAYQQTVIYISHDPELIGIADRMVDL